MNWLLLGEGGFALSGRLGDAPQAFVLDALSDELPEELSPSSTHVFRLADVIKLADTLGTLPGKLVVSERPSRPPGQVVGTAMTPGNLASNG